MTPEEIIARAADSDSLALHALVAGHLQAGRADMAEAALSLSPASMERLDAWFARALENAREAGAVAALVALMDGEADGQQITPARPPGGVAEDP